MDGEGGRQTPWMSTHAQRIGWLLQRRVGLAAMMSRASKYNQSYVVCTFSSLFRMDEAADL